MNKVSNLTVYKLKFFEEVLIPRPLLGVARRKDLVQELDTTRDLSEVLIYQDIQPIE